MCYYLTLLQYVTTYYYYFFSNWACQFLLCQLFGHETARDVDHFIVGVPSGWTALPLMNGWTFLIPMSSSEFELRP